MTSHSSPITRLQRWLHTERLPLSGALLLTTALYIALPPERLLAKPPLVASPAAAASLDIYPAQPPRIRAAHARHADLPCATCHSSDGDHITLPSMERCAECHAADETTAPPLAQCATCHIGYGAQSEVAISSPEQWRAISPPPLIPPRARADLKFSHARHATTPCATCHTGEEMTPPSMASCQSCHDGKTTSGDCTTCHFSRQLRTATSDRFAKHAEGTTAESGTLIPTPLTRRALPESHTQDWLERHGVVSMSRAEQCADCHTEASCLACHNDKSGQLFAVHPPNYLVLHRVAPRAQEQNCTDCHRNEATCLACHAELRASPESAISKGPPTSVPFHPPGWLDPASAANHGVQARRNLNECTSCHQERDCVSCHQGINPHPPDFASRCATALRNNPLPCSKCHTSPIVCP